MNTVKIRFEFAKHEDTSELAQLRVNAMRQSLESVGRFDPERARNRFLDSFDPTQTHKILVDTGLVGFVVVRQLDYGLLLDHLYIDPAFQNQGFGAQALRWVFQRADLGCQKLRVGALTQSRANLFYLHHGFVLVEKTEFDNYYERVPRQC